jgi:hypothetical protein
MVLFFDGTKFSDCHKTTVAKSAVVVAKYGVARKYLLMPVVVSY